MKYRLKTKSNVLNVIRVRIFGFEYEAPSQGSSNMDPTINHRFTVWVNDLKDNTTDFVQLAQIIRWDSVVATPTQPIYGMLTSEWYKLE